MALFDTLSTHDQRTVRRILKVNHAGEYGAIRIYRAQLWIARKRFPEIVPFLEETLDHEIEHCRLFSQSMAKRQTRPCYVMRLWGNGGYVIGLLTALLGKTSIWICTAAVESAVHQHLNDQLKFLDGKDDQLSRLITSIQKEELSHLNYAESQIENETTWSKLLRRTIFIITDILIWLSTWGDSTRMKRTI